MIEGAGVALEPSVVAERLLITTGSMTSLLDTLERRGLVVRKPHPDDRRKLLVDVTSEALTILDQILPSLHQREKSIISSALTEVEQRRLLDLLARIQRAAVDRTNDEPDRAARRVVPARLRR